jgi:uncharacterized protein (TIGR00645 family)
MIDKDDLLNNKDFYKSFKNAEDLTTFFQTMHKRAVEHMLERVMFGSRWLLAPFYLGLTFALIILLIKFFQKFWGFASNVTSTSTDDMVLGLLGLLDLTLLANLILIVIFAGYETFVSKIEVAKDNIDRPEWMGSVDFSGLKLKLIGSLVAISVIELLKDFMNAANGVDETEVKWRIAIHLTFVVSGLAFAIMDWVADLNKKPKGK